MKATNRRDFIQRTTLATAAISVAGAPSLHAADANGKMVLGVIGPGGMGMNHLRSLLTYKDVEVAYVCDVDENRANQAASAVEKGSGKRPRTVKDMRRVFEDKSVDAVFIATPDHWHAPASTMSRSPFHTTFARAGCSWKRRGRKSALCRSARRAAAPRT
jgi:ornithine cyclodeaminase/alanine dehydrogenase-like protein (mu-crystallin family)